jgi:hypothetical protein
MIYLTKGQKLFDNPSLVVYDQTGYYNDGDSVICAGVTSPNEPVCRYEAKFVAYGGIVYSVADSDALMEQILAIDPKTLFGKDSQQVAVDKMVEAIVPQESGVLTEDATTEVVDTATTTPEINVQTPQTSTTTPQVNLPPTSQTSTTTPEFIAPDTSSSTTPQSNTSTTTPVIVLPDTSATSTPPSNISTTTPVDIPITPPATDISSTTPSIAPNVIDTPAVIPSTLETPTDTSATSSEVVAFAKNIIK